MAFKERFKDRNIITGKNGENAQLVPTGAGPKKAVKESAAAESAPQFLQQPPMFGAQGMQPIQPSPVQFGQPPMQLGQPTFKVLNSSPPPPTIQFTKQPMQPMQPMAPAGVQPFKQPPLGMMPSASFGQMVGQTSNSGFQPPSQFAMPPPQMMRQPSMSVGLNAQPQMPMMMQPQGPAALAPPAAGPSRLSIVPQQQQPVQQQQKGGRAPSFMMPQMQMSPTPGASAAPLGQAQAQRQPSFMAGPGFTSVSPMPGFGDIPQPNPASNVGTYNYQQAGQQAAPQTTAESGSKEQKEGVVKHGRRAGSTDPHGRKKHETSNNAECEDERPNTDPQKPSFKPYTLDDYRKMKEETSKMVLRRGLGPVENEEVRAEREKRHKMLEYAANANKINKVLEGDAECEHEKKPIVQPVAQDVLERQQRREKALEFAKHVPKPKVRAKDEVSPAPGHQIGENLDELAAASDQNAAKREKEKALLDLEAKHKRDQLMIENIKKQLKLA